MRPRGIPSRWVKILPWYYTIKNQPTRGAELDRALKQEAIDGGSLQDHEEEARSSQFQE